MLWSLFKIVAFIGIVAAATLGIGYLTEMGGGIRIALGGTEFNLRPVQSVVALVLLLVAVWLVLKILGLGVAFLRFLNGDETALSRWSNRNRERRGYEALSEGLMALASGDGRSAMSKAAKAERYLRRPDLTNLITAQAAEMTGDKAKAQEVYRALLDDEKTRFVGVRGIMKQKLGEGETGTALKLAEMAFALKPKHGETHDILLKLQADSGDWTGARKTLGAKLKNGALPRDVHRRRDAVLALGEAKAIVEEGESIEAREAAIEANRLSPDLIPAAVMAARQYIEAGKPRYAARVLKKAWGSTPHPDLAAAFAEIAPDETPKERVRRFAQLTNQHPTNPETKLLLAELLIAAEDYQAARKAVGDLAESDPTTRSLTIMAAIERGEGSEDAVVKGYLAKAVTASRGSQWVCGSCQNIPGSWVPVCPNCGAFDTLEWRVPPVSQDAQIPGAGMIPLIVGQIEDQSGDTDAEQVEDALEADVLEDQSTPSNGAAANGHAANGATPPEVEKVIEGEVLELGPNHAVKN